MKKRHEIIKLMMIKRHSSAHGSTLIFREDLCFTSRPAFVSSEHTFDHPSCRMMLIWILLGPFFFSNVRSNNPAKGTRGARAESGASLAPPSGTDPASRLSILPVLCPLSLTPRSLPLADSPSLLFSPARHLEEFQFIRKVVTTKCSDTYADTALLVHSYQLARCKQRRVDGTERSSYALRIVSS